MNKIFPIKSDQTADNLPIMKFRRYLVFFLLSLCLVSSGLQAAEELSYDRYASILREKPESNCLLAKFATDFLTYPLELVRWPMDQGFLFSDEHYLMDKGRWMYEQGIEYGVTPRFDGVDFDLFRMARIKGKYPDTTLKSWISFWPDDYFVAGGRVGFERIAETPIHTFVNVNYEDRKEENFYGIGPDTSRGDGAAYHLEATQVQAEIGYSPDPSLSFDTFAAYRRFNISDGTDGGRGKIQHVFDDVTIPGLEGDEIFATGIMLARDTRNQKQNSTHGYLGKVGFSFNEGLYGSRARFFRYDAEYIHYLRLASDRRVFVTRFYGEHNNETKGHEVPFHQMAKLGGFGTSVHSSQTFRGFDENRFFGETLALMNLEYRYTVYEYREWKMDTILFYDSGQVFDNFGKFQFGDFEGTYGGGFRVSILNNTLLDFTLGHGDEGTHLYVKSRAPF